MARVVRGITLRTGNVITGPKHTKKAQWKPPLPSAADLGRQYKALKPTALVLPPEVLAEEKEDAIRTVKPKPKRKYVKRAISVKAYGFIGDICGNKVEIWKENKDMLLERILSGNGIMLAQYKRGDKVIIAEIANGVVVNEQGN